ncbi:MAG: glycosyltransferase family 4 protein [Methanoregula sp.]|jgi:glycosyltransferase involved in cell wall biosynthesis|nr:glycosyltransferase family 4 protein [Methanoregula sp.]
MNITLILDYSDKRNSGGPQGVAYDTIEGLKKNNRRLEKEDIFFHVLSTTGTTLRSVSGKDDTCGNISVEYFKKLVPTALLSDVNYFLRIKKGEQKIDLIHSHTVSGAFVGTLLKIPTIFTLHGMMWREKNYTHGLYSRFTYEVNIQRFNYFSHRLKKLIAISPYVVSEVDQYLKTRIPDTEVIENPVSDAFFEQEKREKEGLILYPAYFNSLKNQYNLIEALYRLKKDKIRFHCILPGTIMDQGYFATIKKLIQTRNLEDDITIPGPVPFGQMLRLYSEASVMVITSYQETAPLVISEAMASGTPVIASRVSGIPHMVSEGNSGFLINPADPAEIAEKIRTVLDDGSLRKKFGGESRQIAATRWKSEVITNKLIDTYMHQAH